MLKPSVIYCIVGVVMLKRGDPAILHFKVEVLVLVVRDLQLAVFRAIPDRGAMGDLDEVRTLTE